MKTSMKKRIVSALLTLAMLASFLPAELFPKAEAVAGLKLEIVKLDPNTGAYEIKVTNGHWWTLQPEVRFPGPCPGA